MSFVDSVFTRVKICIEIARIQKMENTAACKLIENPKLSMYTHPNDDYAPSPH